MKGSDNQRLVVWGERRDPPDWDRFLEGLVSWAMREVERQSVQHERLGSVLWAVAEQKYRRLYP